MKILLDTQIFLWLLEYDDRLSSKIVDVLESGEHDIFLSIVSLWEIAIKISNGKLAIPGDDIVALAGLAEGRGTQLLPIHVRHLALLKALPKYHRDPFDRLIICQAKAEGMLLASADGTLRRYDVQLLG